VTGRFTGLSILPHGLLCPVTSQIQLLSIQLELRILGVYSICCECSQVYSGQMGHSIDTILKKHHQHIQLEHLDMSAMAENSINLGHHI
jgi:hypothetical protein